jgi:heme/copper-type cytochrome/quinol oxidase subunit 2
LRHRRKRAVSLPQILDLLGKSALVLGALFVLAWAVATGRGRDIAVFALAGFVLVALGVSALLAALVVRARRRQHDREVNHRRRMGRAV